MHPCETFHAGADTMFIGMYVHGILNAYHLGCSLPLFPDHASKGPDATRFSTSSVDAAPRLVNRHISYREANSPESTRAACAGLPRVKLLHRIAAP